MSRASMLAVEDGPRQGLAPPSARLERLFAEHHALVWRTSRRLGLSPAEAAEATRCVFRDAAKQLDGMRRHEERARLLALVLHHAFRVEPFAVSEVRMRPPLARRPPARSGVMFRRRPAVPAACVDLMDRVLSHMPRPEATAFILFELERLSLAEVGQVLSLGPVAVERILLRARAEFHSIVAALRPAARR